jgi:hypothetical protein
MVIRDVLFVESAVLALVFEEEKLLDQPTCVALDNSGVGLEVSGYFGHQFQGHLGV